MARKRICIVSAFPLSLSRGGLEVQAERTLEELQAQDTRYNYDFFDWRTRSLADAYHFFGNPPHLWEIIASVHEQRRPYVVTLLTGIRQDFFNPWIRDRIKGLLKMPRNSEMLGRAKRVIMLTELEQSLLCRTFGIPPDKSVVIPNFIDDAFFSATTDAWQQRQGSQPFILCVGLVQQRKNQLLLARAANALQLPLVLLGAAVHGETHYAQQVQKAMSENERFGGQWIQGLHQADPVLISAHRACRLFVLLSSAETQPLSIMQAMAAGRPVLIGKSLYTQSPPFETLPSVNLDNFGEVCAALKNAWDSGVPTQLPDRYRSPAIVGELASVYSQLLN